MKIIVYTDVHGNKYALKALQRTKEYKKADLRVFLGDAVMACPYPNECLKRIWKSGDVFLLGNHDCYFAFGLPKEEALYFKAEKRQHQNYMKEKTLPKYLEKLKEMPREYYFDCFGKRFYFAHYAWQAEHLIQHDPDGPKAPTVKTAELFKDIDADYILFGHNHTYSKFECDGKTFICVGSLGIRYPGNYLVIDIDENHIEIEHKQIDFNVEKLKREMLTENYPRALKYIKSFDKK